MPIDAEELAALLPPLDPAPGSALTGGGTADGLRFTGLELTGDATGARFLECVLEDCELAGVPFDRARFTSCRLSDLRASAWSLVDATLLDVVLTGGRLGALTAHGCGVTRARLQDLKVDLLDLGSATLVDVTLAGCTIGELDLTSAELRDVRFLDCTVGSLLLESTRCRDVDLRGATISRLVGVAGLRGCTISSGQVTGWAPALAAELGIAVG